MDGRYRRLKVGDSCAPLGDRWALAAGLLLIAALTAIAGCDTFTKVKAENPVMPPAPPRISAAEGANDERALAQNVDASTAGMTTTAVTPIDFQAGGRGRDPSLAGSDVVATVNGIAVFGDDVLDCSEIGPPNSRVRCTQFMGKMSADPAATPEARQELRLKLIERCLPNHCDRELLLQALKSTVTKEQMEGIEGQLGKIFEGQCEEMKKEYGVNTNHELDLKLQSDQFITLDKLRKDFIQDGMAQAFLSEKSKSTKEIDRAEMFDYYHQHIDDYRIAAKVRWQQIVIEFDKNGGRRGAFEKLEKAIAELRRGVDFGDVAGQFSDGPKAQEKGEWGWMEAGSLSDEELEKTLFDLPLEMVSEVIERKDSFRLVRVHERSEAGVVQFGEVQEKIRQQLKNAAAVEARQMFLADLQAKAAIKTVFDRPEQTLANETSRAPLAQ